VVPLAPVLVAAEYVGDNWIDLAFDRAIDVSGVDGNNIAVYDGTGVGFWYVAAGTVDVLSPTSVRLGLIGQADWAGPDVHLDAAAGNGIVAVAGGAEWPGVSGVVLPFP
jgi:hypothetical protein